MKTLKAFAIVALALSNVALAGNAGQRPFNAKCASCHGKEGKGDTEMGKKRHARDLSDAKVQSGMTDEEITKAITDGIPEKLPDHGHDAVVQGKAVGR